MNKSELIDAIAEKGGLSKSDAGKALDATIASIGEALKTGEELQIKASKVPSFKAGKGLKDSVA